MGAWNDSVVSAPENATQDADETEDRRWLGIATTAAVILILLLAWWLFTRFSSIPDVMGMSEREAMDTIEEAGFLVGDITLVDSPETETGTVAAQSPEAGTHRVRGTVVQLDVAQASEGSSSDNESRSSNELGILPPTSAATPGENDYVPETGPVPTIDTRPRMVSVLGMTEADARATLQRAGLAFTVDYGPTTASPQGRVCYQDPPPDTAYDAGISVNIWVSTGPPSLESPYSQPGDTSP